MGVSDHERLQPGCVDSTAVEHLHRYALARDLVRGLDVLDVASGEGYGSALLAEMGRSVIGVDVDAAAVAAASAKYRLPNLRYAHGSATALLMPDAAVDAVTSFETLEHLAAHDDMLAEIRRVLRPGGLLIISTPDREEYSARSHYKNPHHVRELDAREFRALLDAHFKNVALLGQRMVFGSAMLPESEASGVLMHRGNFLEIHSAKALPEPRYLVALCSDGPLPAPPASFFEEETSSLNLDTVFQIAPASAGIVSSVLRRFRETQPSVRLISPLECMVRSFTVTLRGSTPIAASAVRVRVGEKEFFGEVANAAFQIEVNVGSGRKPCDLEWRDADGNWHAAGAVRIDAPEVHFTAHERDP